MTSPRGRLVAQLDLQNQSSIAELIPLVNQRIKPPTPLSESDLFIRAMYILSDQTNAYGGKFPVDEHARLAELLIDSPVLVGHRRDLLPIGRTFHAVCLEQDGRNWVKSYFYWLKSAEGAETLRDNIDAGIYKECSIGFVYGLPECTICGKDIRLCAHQPMQRYSINGESTECCFNYRQIDRVLETSLVYRGAIPDTSITRDLAIRKSTGTPEPVILSALSQLPSADRYLVTPRYDGIDIKLTACPHGWSLSRLNGELVDLPIDQLAASLTPDKDRFARLVGFRGRERFSSRHLERYLADSSGPISRTTLYIYPLDESELQSLQKPIESLACRFIRSRFVTPDQLESAVAEIATRDGAEIRPLDQTASAHCYLYRPDTGTARSSDPITLARLAHSDDWLLDIRQDQHVQFIIRQFDPARFRQSARFVADPILPPMQIPTDPQAQLTWRQANLTTTGPSLTLSVGEKQGGELRLQPIRLQGKPRYLFYRIDQPSPTGKEHA
ncbi:MAG: hypothetical protein IPH75_13495 [bacterium]|nr:hypothetical protein [bacterium]